MESMRGKVLYFGASDELLLQALSWKSRPHSAEISAFIPFYSGKVRFYLMRTKEALEDLQEAKTQLIKLNYHYEAADCLLRTGRCWAVLGEFHRALEVVNETIRLYEQLGASDERGFLNKSRYLKGTNIWGDELSTTLQTALELSQELGKPVHTALVLDEFGEMYVHRKDWAAARLDIGRLSRNWMDFLIIRLPGSSPTLRTTFFTLRRRKTTDRIVTSNSGLLKDFDLSGL